MLRQILVVFCLILVKTDISFGESTKFIDKNSKIKNLAEKEWFLENIPFIDIPEHNIEEVYYYRWSSHKRHLRYTTLAGGYAVTEFVHDVGYGKKFGEINAAGGHQIYESRWLKNRKYAKDYINFYARQMDRAGNHQYSEWIADAAYNTFLVNGDKDFITSQLDGFVKIYDDWSDHFEPKLGLYFISPVWDAQEFSAASVQTKDQFGGGVGYRPSHNSEMYANAEAIVKIAHLKGDTKIENEFKTKAKSLRESIIKHLWDNKRNFFYHMQRDNNPNHLLLDTREEVGLYPWRFSVPDDSHNFSIAFNELVDKQGFDTEFGPPTCEARSKWYDGEQKPVKCCWWNGNSWPYSTAHVLRSVATHLRQYSHQNPKITVNDYYTLLLKYAKTQYKNNKPYVAECHSPVHDFWVCDSRNHSEHYAHSTYTDNVLTELMGIQPQEDSKLVIDPLVPKTWNHFAVENFLYHGFDISIVYDSNGEKYKTGKGLTVFVNGEKKAHRDDLGKLVVEVGNYKPATVHTRYENYAANPYRRGYPRPYASFSDNNPGTTYQAVDGRIFYDNIPSNRWSNWDSKHETDWFAVDFGREKTFSSVNIYVYSDVVTNEGKTDCPTKMVVQYMNNKNEWKDTENQVSVPSKCSPNDLNRISFTSVKTSQLRVVFTRNVEKGYYVGITEFEAWAPFPQTPSPDIYEVEDGIITDAMMEKSDSASGHSYVGLIDKKESNVEMSGIYVSKSGEYKVRVFYANGEKQNSSHNLSVNYMKTIVVTYPPTALGWAHFSDKNFVEVTVPLLYGNNILQFEHHISSAELDKIQIIH